MDAFEFIRSRLADEDSRYASGAASTVVGTAICRALMHEAALEDRRRKNNEAPRNDQELLVAALDYVDQNWPDEMSKAQHVVEACAIGLLDDRLKKAIEYGLHDAAAQERPVWFAIWTGVLANTAWLLLGAFILFLVLLWTGNSLDTAVKNLLLNAS